MAASPSYTFSQSQLQPVYNPAQARSRNVNLAAGTYLRGTVLGQVTNVGADAVQTITVSGTPTGGTVVVNVSPTTINAPNTITLNYNNTVAAAQPLFDAVYGPGNTKVTGTTLPGGSLIVTFIGDLAGQPVTAFTKGANGLTGGSSPDFAIAQTTTGVLNVGTFAAFAHGNSDGTQVAKGLLMYPCTVDASGNITFSTEIPRLTENAAPIYWAGAFRSEELVGLPTAGQMAVDFPGARV